MSIEKITTWELLIEYLSRLEQEIKQIASSLDRSANAAEATQKLYKQSNEATKRAMDAREERERESNQRGRERHQFDKEQHDQWMKGEKLRQDREELFKKRIEEEEKRKLTI